MSLKIVTFTLIILLALIPKAQQVKAQVYELAPLPDRAKSTNLSPYSSSTNHEIFSMSKIIITNTTRSYDIEGD
jgi:hypothetical protein